MHCYLPITQDYKTYRPQDRGRFERELIEPAIESFRKNLQRLRELAPVRTICMHGSPLSKWDNRLLWKYYDYRDFGIIGEAYFDTDFNEVLYLTDTGRRWDGEAVNIRDKAQRRSGAMAQGKEGPGEQPATSNQQPATLPKIHSTFDIITAAKTGTLPDKVMLTVHPQRWNNRPLPWLRELIWQNIKNPVKRLLSR